MFAIFISICVAIAASARFCSAQHQPAPQPPQSTDNRSQVSLREMTLTVGPGGQLQGTDDFAIQSGIDYLTRFGGGVLKLLPGEYAMRNAVHLPSDVILRGSGKDTILKKAPSVNVPLTRDVDWYECSVQVSDASGFTPGCGLLLRSNINPEKGMTGLHVEKLTVTAIEGNTLFLNRRLNSNFWIRENASATSAFALLTSEDTKNVRIEDLVIDGNKPQNEQIDGNICGGVFLLRCEKYSFKNVTARNYNGDGFSLQICDDLSFENCVAESNGLYGFHLGSGSQRPILKNCSALSNSIGIFFCWGVNDAVIDNAACSDNSSYGLLLGHRDADNKIVNCSIERNGKAGVIFTKQMDVFDGAHRNTITDSRIRDNGPEEPGVGIAIEEPNRDIVITNNAFEDTGPGRQKVAIWINPNIEGVKVDGNKFINQASEVDKSVSIKERIKELLGR
jgi:nitrous oxidase accessory protein NosD